MADRISSSSLCVPFPELAEVELTISMGRSKGGCDTPGERQFVIRSCFGPVSLAERGCEGGEAIAESRLTPTISEQNSYPYCRNTFDLVGTSRSPRTRLQN